MEFTFKVDFGAGLEGRLLGAGGGEGYGRHNGVIGELITTSALFDVEISLLDLCAIGREDGGVGLYWLWFENCFIYEIKETL